MRAPAGNGLFFILFFLLIDLSFFFLVKLDLKKKMNSSITHTLDTIITFKNFCLEESQKKGEPVAVFGV